jgi:hypothetical protein
MMAGTSMAVRGPGEAAWSKRSTEAACCDDMTRKRVEERWGVLKHATSGFEARALLAGVRRAVGSES